MPSPTSHWAPQVCPTAQAGRSHRTARNAHITGRDIVMPTSQGRTDTPSTEVYRSPCSTVAPAQDPEEGRDIRVRGHIPVPVKVRQPACAAAVPCDAREERLD